MPRRTRQESATPREPDAAANPVLQLPVRQLLVDGVYESVRAMIMDHAIAPNDRISIDGLARDLRVSPTPMREALARLESEGLVVKEPLRGYSATSLLSREAFKDLYELRLLLEPWAAARAAERLTPDGRQRLEAELATCPVTTDAGDTSYHAYRMTLAHDGRFHDLIVELSGSDQVRGAFERTHAHLHLFRLGYGRSYGFLTLDEHTAIAHAIMDRSPGSAEDAMRAHLIQSRDRLLPMAE